MQQLLTFLQSPYSLILLVWILIWKGIALWKAATKRQLIWFVVLLVLNSLSLFEILYVFWLSRWSFDKDRKILDFLSEKIGKKVKTP